MMVRQSRLPVLLLLLTSLSLIRSLHIPPIHVSLKAKWKGTPFLLEAGEFIANESPNLYFEFIDRWINGTDLVSFEYGHPEVLASSSISSSLSSPLSTVCFESILNTSSSFVGTFLRPLLHLSLSMRTKSPAVSAFRQLASLSLMRFYRQGRNDAGNPAGAFSKNDSSVAFGKLFSTTKSPLLFKVPARKLLASCSWAEIREWNCNDENSIFLSNGAQLERWLSNKRNGIEGGEPAREGDCSLSASSASNPLFAFDHVFTAEEREGEGEKGVGREGRETTVFLYGSPGLPGFSEMYRALRNAATEGILRFVFRPVVSDSCTLSSPSSVSEQYQQLTDPSPVLSHCSLLGSSSPVLLGGFGAELALKNMEYKAIDDSKERKREGESEGESEGEGEQEDLSKDVKGFLFAKLIERKPEFKDDLALFRDHLLISSEGGEGGGLREDFNVWEIKDLGLQASHKILKAHDPIRMLQEISANFPMLIESLSRVKVNPAMEKDLKQLHSRIRPGFNALSINGILYQTETLDVFELAEVAQTELSLASHFSELHLPMAAIRSLLSSPVPKEKKGEGGEVRLDFRAEPEFVHVLNDIEKDKKYKHFRPNLQEILMPLYPGQMHYIRKNLFHVTLLIDLAQTKSIQMLSQMFYFYENDLPFTFSLVLFSSSSLPASGGREKISEEKERNQQEGTSASDLAIRLFYHLEEFSGKEDAFLFLEMIRSEYLSFAEEQSEAGFSHDLSSSPSISPFLPVKAIEKAFVKTLEETDTTESASEILRKYSLPGGVESSEEFVPNKLFNSPAESTSYVLRMGLCKDSLPAFLFNGAFQDAKEYPDALFHLMHGDVQLIQRAVYFRELNSRMDVLDFLMEGKKTKRINQEILSKRSNNRYCSLLPFLSRSLALPPEQVPFLHAPGTEDDVKPMTHLIFLDISTPSGFALLVQSLRYLAEENSAKQSRIGYVFLPFASPSFSSSLLHLILRSAQRLPTRRQKLVPFLRSLLSFSSFRDALSSLPLSSSSPSLPPSLLDPLFSVARETGINTEDLKRILQGEEGGEKERRKGQLLFKKICKGGSQSQTCINSNGRILKPRSNLVAEDISLLDSVEENRLKKTFQIVSAVDRWEGVDPDDVTSEFLSNVIMGVTSSMAAKDREGDTAEFMQSLTSGPWSVLLNHRSSSSPSSPELSPIHVDVLVDPLSPAAQRLSPLLLFLQEWIKPSLRLILNPRTDLSEIPLKSFYSFAAFDKRFLSPPSLLFSQMPPSKTLTLNLKAPEAWLVEPVESEYDLDNLVLKDIASDRVKAVFELEALMLTGHCYERETQDAPRGLQLVLGASIKGKGVSLPFSSSLSPSPALPFSFSHISDTIVMENLGYFQLKALPGVWSLMIAQGRSSELFMLAAEKDKERERETQIANQGSSAGELKGEREGAEEEFGLDVAVLGLGGENLKLDVVKREGKESENLLFLSGEEGGEDGDEEGDYSHYGQEEGQEEGEGGEEGGSGMWASVKKLIGGGKEKGSGEKGEEGESNEKQVSSLLSSPSQETVNIFSIASGHLYERFTLIMILSLVKTTKRPVKFWFIKNFLSPKFKNTIPHMASSYNFTFSFVSYKWPSWLFKQTEKQRMIWAYKILFLDVIFPLSLKKVIFCDADQIIRSDIGELYDLNLQSKPLAYTPMCDNNKEMEGYRFWKGGFWHDHLQGRPYHISALYVVDLVKFRQMAAGDRYRVVYESLARDPNSLANLDQDLPNYVQHQVPIFSLPQPWLWCESWCGNETKSKAKTIDLCNNPMTKEPKLEGARRIVSEWVSLDEEQKRFTERVEAGEFDREEEEEEGEEREGWERVVGETTREQEGQATLKGGEECTGEAKEGQVGNSEKQASLSTQNGGAKIDQEGFEKDEL